MYIFFSPLPFSTQISFHKTFQIVFTFARSAELLCVCLCAISFHLFFFHSHASDSRKIYIDRNRNHEPLHTVIYRYIYICLWYYACVCACVWAHYFMLDSFHRWIWWMKNDDFSTVRALLLLLLILLSNIALTIRSFSRRLYSSSVLSLYQCCTLQRTYIYTLSMYTEQRYTYR